ncbi:carbohydrate ABC transporter permease [Jannaschia seohaensis]|uniref:Glycerol transport system permease protein n=1 Tax=Jannaschia seohaensis TaxID=475081 RepID=A0A2Y9AY89_9RHOB|nr:carbohydrate ABC transporter permease [Jannaschia seohaensis]PWJ16194.1 glycerol transport system permease protein [Jannaschia seohaensis]SSA49211.1 glycerol transport system permease protein [Jannaschia seohaensis]
MKRVFQTLGFAALTLFVLLPLVQVVLLSFTSTITREDVVLGSATWLNFANVFATERLAASLVNSTIYVTLNVGLCIAVALPAAYAFSRYRFRGARAAFFTLIAFRVTPPVVLSLPVFLVFSELNLLNTPVGVALAHSIFNVPIAIWILESFISAVPRQLDETAFLDGYSTPRFVVTQLLPVIAPGIGVTAFFCFMFSWVEVVFARTLTVTDGKPITTAIGSLFGFRTDIGLVMAMTVLSLIPGLVMIWFVRNHISRGFTVRV